MNLKKYHTLNYIDKKRDVKYESGSGHGALNISRSTFYNKYLSSSSVYDRSKLLYNVLYR